MDDPFLTLGAWPVSACYSINRTATIHRCSTPYSDTRGTDPGGHYGSRDRPRPQYDARPYDAPDGYATYWQYTTALACSALVATNPVISSADNAIESFILASSIRNL
jgi:hypothetical protein